MIAPTTKASLSTRDNYPGHVENGTFIVGANTQAFEVSDTEVASPAGYGHFHDQRRTHHELVFNIMEFLQGDIGSGNVFFCPTLAMTFRDTRYLKCVIFAYDAVTASL